MDTITHSLLGAVTVRALLPASGSHHPFSDRQRMSVGAVAAAFPDIDYIASWIDPIVYLTRWHRSITHSFLLLPLWALLTGLVFSMIFRQRNEWRFLSLLAGLAILSHILSDLITVYGTQVLAPFSSWRASVGTTFIIDPWFTVIVLAGFVAGVRGRPVWLPAASLPVLCLYIALQAGFKYQALSIARDHSADSGLVTANATALPQPFSPMNWKLVIDAGDFYEVAYVSLAGGYAVASDADGFWAKVGRTYQDSREVSWQRIYRYGDGAPGRETVRGYWEHPKLDDFRGFAAFPALHRIDRGSGRLCVWFTDLRYVLPYMRPPFQYAVCEPEHDTGSG